MNPPRSLNSKLKNLDPELRNLFSEMKREIQRLQKQNAKLEVRRISDQSKIKALEKLQPQPASINIHYPNSSSKKESKS